MLVCWTWFLLCNRIFPLYNEVHKLPSVSVHAQAYIRRTVPAGRGHGRLYTSQAAPPVEYPDTYFRLHHSPSALRGSGLRALPSQAGHSQAIARRGSAAETS